MRTLLALTVVCLLVEGAVSASEIHDACYEGDLDTVRSLVAEDQERVSERNERNEMPIHVAAAGGHIEVVRFLVEHGVPVDAGDNENSTALDVAAIFGHEELARMLVANGADPAHSDVNGMTPLHFACYNGNASIGAFLIEQGASPTATTVSGSTPLHGAAFDGDIDCMTLLLDNGASLDARNAAGFTPVLSACAGTADVAALQFLVERGADIHDRNFGGATSLMLAAGSRKYDEASYLVEQGVGLEGRNNFGWTALLIAVEGGNPELVEFLLDGGADANTIDPFGRSVLWWAALRGQTEIVSLLIDRGASVTDEGPPAPMSALGRSVMGGHYEIAELLLENGIDADGADPDMSRTALHLAALGGWANFAGLLADHGADLSLTDSYGMTALDYAWKYGHDDVAGLLETRGATATGRRSDYAGSPLLERDVEVGEASMWYLGHCGWALKTENHLLIFDYWTGQGELPSRPCLRNGHIDPTELADENVYVFVTHEHADHYDPAINSWGDSHGDLTYVFGFRPELTPEYREGGYDGPAYEYIAPREYREFDDIKVRTIAANDGGVAFLVEVDGLKFYHAGDHAGWADGERDGYFEEIDYLTPYADDLDMAFVNVTGCHAHDPERLLEGNLYTIERMSPRVLVPTHAIGREYVYADAAAEMADAGVTAAFCCPMNRGDTYFFNGEGIE
jgi:ankyrin repeat protein/L-ascorbate metabolism protein UlaG (beta-lactamase superfamily)